MKTIEEVKEETIGNDVYTFEDFFEMVKAGSINRYDGEGYFHDGENETDVSVWSRMLSLLEITQYPYVCWYNK